MTQWQDLYHVPWWSSMWVHAWYREASVEFFTDLRNVWGQASLGGPALSLKNLAMECRNLPPKPRYTAAYLSSPLTKRGSFKAISPEFWRESWAMKYPPTLRKPSNSDERTWYNLSHEASLLANLCFDCTIPNKSSNSQNSRWSWHSFLELCFAYCFSFLSSGLTKDRILGWTACFAWGGSDFG